MPKLEQKKSLMTFLRTYHAMDLLQTINDVVRSNLNHEIASSDPSGRKQSINQFSGNIQLLEKALRRDCVNEGDPRFLLQPPLQVICRLCPRSVQQCVSHSVQQQQHLPVEACTTRWMGGRHISGRSTKLDPALFFPIQAFIHLFHKALTFSPSSMCLVPFATSLAFSIGGKFLLLSQKPGEDIRTNW